MLVADANLMFGQGPHVFRLRDSQAPLPPIFDLDKFIFLMNQGQLINASGFMREMFGPIAVSGYLSVLSDNARLMGIGE